MERVVTIKEDKDMALMIKDKYNLFNINISKADLDDSAIGALINTVDSIVNAYNLENSGLNLDDVKYIIDDNGDAHIQGIGNINFYTSQSGF